MEPLAGVESKPMKIENKKKFYLKLILFVFLVSLLSLCMASKIKFVDADLGRHIKNGEWTVNSGFNLYEKKSPVFENFYSYTNPDYPVANHHWGSGVIFYFIHKFAGFQGLSAFYVISSAIVFSVFFVVAYRESDFATAFLFSGLLIPLMAERREIRPEIWSYLLAGVFFLILWLWTRKKISHRSIWVLPLIVILWVNLHIYFFLGFFLIGFFLASELAGIVFLRLSDEEFGEKTRKIKILFAVLALSGLASLANPFGLKGLTYPFSIFRNYGYTIVENKSVSFVENYGVANPNFALVKAVLILMVFSFVLLFAVDRKKISACYLFIAVFFGVMGWVSIRNLSLLGFFALPVMSHNFHSIFRQNKNETNLAKENGIAVLYIVLIILSLYSSTRFILAHKKNIGIGLAPQANDAAEFMKKNSISGPFYNNYDIGGYLIYHFGGSEKVFVDNRPEAYPDLFFSEVYKPMGERDDVWNEQDKKWNFNAIIFCYHDITPWGQGFLKNIESDKNWAEVYKDDYAIIFLKRNEANDELIRKYEIS